MTRMTCCIPRMILSDPRKEFVCSKRGHKVNDMLRPWGKQSECPYCVVYELEHRGQVMKKEK